MAFLLRWNLNSPTQMVTVNCLLYSHDITDFLKNEHCSNNLRRTTKQNLTNSLLLYPVHQKERRRKQFVLSNSSISVRQLLHRYAKTTRCSPAGQETGYLILKTDAFTCISFQQLIRRWYCDCDRHIKESLKILRQCSKG